MIKFENTEVVGWEHAIRGMRNPLESWERSDTYFCTIDSTGECRNPNLLCEDCDIRDITLGQNDLGLMTRLRNAGTDHRKFMRMIVVYVDITAPLYWWKEFDTYKVGTVSNSCSTMHSIHKKEFTLEDFSCEHLIGTSEQYSVPDSSKVTYLVDFKIQFEQIISTLNNARQLYIETKDKKYWWQMIQLLPSSYNQKRTVMMNYEVLLNIYHARKNHKLDEWHTICDWIETLPYFKEICLEE